MVILTMTLEMLLTTTVIDSANLLPVSISASVWHLDVHDRHQHESVRRQWRAALWQQDPHRHFRHGELADYASVSIISC